MISLRLTGTKAAAEELAEMGEDTDTMITTQSKLRSTIMEATKVSSNQFKGFDILDDNGNYKSTYEILQGIADVYQEIVEQDEKTHSNQKNLLLETVAGKNRSSVAAAIFSNPQILRDVYESSQQSKGSAQAELDKYLDSIEGKTAQLQNRLQQLASTAIDSDFLKGAIDGLTKMLELANSIVNTFGTLPTILGAVAGFFAQKNGLGRLHLRSKLHLQSKQFPGGRSPENATLLVMRTMPRMDQIRKAVFLNMPNNGGDLARENPVATLSCCRRQRDTTLLP